MRRKLLRALIFTAVITFVGKVVGFALYLHFGVTAAQWLMDAVHAVGISMILTGAALVIGGVIAVLANRRSRAARRRVGEVRYLTGPAAQARAVREQQAGMNWRARLGREVRERLHPSAAPRPRTKLRDMPTGSLAMLAGGLVRLGDSSGPRTDVSLSAVHEELRRRTEAGRRPAGARAGR